MFFFIQRDYTFICTCGLYERSTDFESAVSVRFDLFIPAFLVKSSRGEEPFKGVCRGVDIGGVLVRVF